MSGSGWRRRVRPGAVATVGVALVAAVAAGCTGGGGRGESAMSATGGGSTDAADAARPFGGAAEDRAADKPGAEETGSTGGANRPALQTRAVIRKGEVSLVTKAMNRARTEVDDLLGRLGGYLDSEDSTNDRAGRPELSVLVLRVPEPAFDDAMDALADIGRTRSATRTSEDVTTQVIDVDARVATQEASLARLRTFLRRASDVADMIRVEQEIASREAELESLKAQQKYLHDQTAMSTITVRLRTPAAPPPSGPDRTGFLAGLQNGWHALAAVLVGVATVAGAVLPFAAAVALVGVPVWLGFRAARRRRPEPPPAAPAAG
jgi:hypothetical protein